MGFALVPQVLKGFKSKKKSVLPLTAGLTSFGLFAMVVSFFSLGLHFSFVVTSICFILWGILFFQSIRFR